MATRSREKATARKENADKRAHAVAKYKNKPKQS